LPMSLAASWATFTEYADWSSTITILAACSTPTKKLAAV
jgi:hypothetical protein